MFIGANVESTVRAIRFSTEREGLTQPLEALRNNIEVVPKEVSNSQLYYRLTEIAKAFGGTVTVDENTLQTFNTYNADLLQRTVEALDAFAKSGNEAALSKSVAELRNHLEVEASVENHLKGIDLRKRQPSYEWINHRDRKDAFNTLNELARRTVPESGPNHVPIVATHQLTYVNVTQQALFESDLLEQVALKTFQMSDRTAEDMAALGGKLGFAENHIRIAAVTGEVNRAFPADKPFGPGQIFPLLNALAPWTGQKLQHTGEGLKQWPTQAEATALHELVTGELSRYDLHNRRGVFWTAIGAGDHRDAVGRQRDIVREFRVLQEEFATKQGIALVAFVHQPDQA